MAKNRFEYRNDNGSIRIMKVIERLSDGTRIFEDGSRARASKCKLNGEYMELRELGGREYEEWNEELLRKISAGLSEFYAKNEEKD